MYAVATHRKLAEEKRGIKVNVPLKNWLNGHNFQGQRSPQKSRRFLLAPVEGWMKTLRNKLDKNIKESSYQYMFLVLWCRSFPWDLAVRATYCKSTVSFQSHYTTMKWLLWGLTSSNMSTIGLIGSTRVSALQWYRSNYVIHIDCLGTPVCRNIQTHHFRIGENNCV